MKFITLSTALVFISITFAFGQKIEIGQDATDVKRLVEWATKDHNRPDTYGNTQNSYWTSDAKYYNGQITDVIQCYENQFLYDFKQVVNYCKHYAMEKGKLAYILTQFEDISLEKLQKKYDNDKTVIKTNDYYFANDYKHYSKLYLSDNGYPTVEWRKTETKDLPVNLQETINEKSIEQERVEAWHRKDEIEKKEREKELKSKTYDLEIYDKAKYDAFIVQFRQSLISSLKANPSFPDWDQISRDGKCFTFKNSYLAHFKMVNYGSESVDYGSVTVAGTNAYRTESQFTLITGDDKYSEIIKKVSANLQLINNVDGNKYNWVMTEATVKELNILCIKGITEIKIKHGDVTYLKDTPPEEVKQIITDNLKLFGTNGSYQIRYVAGTAMGEDFLHYDKVK